ncbi:hypothetical protein BTO04_13940 [Polaribacter sp. SA4-10]|uniref:hypothetical protein n=1 Tax=Polaribacter sp. SA4-10 TaxID=754397 RepID=UPI000B3C853F|nr:hypothetical protein [Polaribacter sp. SA4-10]ARV07727.1 hypothetical protein BTO04_13940 [Polaribacter sp. SA4-10]
MSLITNFPEIHDFFCKNTFDNNELNKFIEKIKTIYSDKQIQKSALEFIKLELFKFLIESESENVSNSKKEKLEYVPLKKVKKITISTKEKLKLEKEKSQSIILEKLKEENINIICKEVDIKTSYFITLLKQQNITKAVDSKLNQTEFEIIKHILVSKLDRLERINKEETKLLRDRNKKKKIRSLDFDKETVYTKISNNKGIGKIIYIRKK